MNNEMNKNVVDSNLTFYLILCKTITYERIAVDLHSGRLFGSFGVTLIDLVTIGIIILSFTGAYSWIRHKKIF